MTMTLDDATPDIAVVSLADNCGILGESQDLLVDSINRSLLQSNPTSNTNVTTSVVPPSECESNDPALCCGRRL